nr:uncharacterized protein CXorf51A-like [Equus asinus]
MADEICTPEEPSINMEQPTVSTEHPPPRTKGKKERKIPCRSKTRDNGKVQKKTRKAKRPLQRNSRKESPQLSSSCSRMPKRAIRPTIFICYHEQTKIQNENEQRRNKGHWRIQQCQITSCGARKCRAWARGQQLAAASSEAAWRNGETHGDQI